MYGVVAGIAVVVAGLVFLGYRYRPWEFLRAVQRQPAAIVGQVSWEERGPTPEGENGFTPQGLTWVNDRLLFANSWQNDKSRVYRIDPESMEIEAHFDMPAGANHTSGLAWDGKYLWAVDYLTNFGYQIDLERSFAQQEASVVGSFDTTLRGTSAACFVTIEGKTLLAISDYMNSRRTIFVDYESAMADGTARNHIEFSYKNEGLSQGLEFDGRYLYEAENKLGNDVINKIDIQMLLDTGNSRDSTIYQYNSPHRGVEDLAWDGRSFWTSDELSFRFYRGGLR